MDFGFKVSARAERDLIAIWRQIAKDSPVNATRFCDGLISAAESLTNFPQRHGCLHNRPSARKLPHANYLIVYQIDEESKMVEILRFWHGARDQRRLRLKEETAAQYQAVKLGA